MAGAVSREDGTGWGCYICEADVCTFADVIVSCVHKVELIILLHLLYHCWSVAAVFYILKYVIFPPYLSFQSNSPTSHMFPFLSFIFQLYYSIPPYVYLYAYPCLLYFKVFLSVVLCNWSCFSLKFFIQLQFLRSLHIAVCIYSISLTRN